MTIPDWKVDYRDQGLGNYKTLNFSFNTFDARLVIKRKSGFYVWKVIVPLSLVVMMSWSVFWIDAKNIAAQLTVSVTAILTLIAFQFSVSQMLPAVPYLTTLDKFTLGTDFIVFLAFAESIITTLLYDNGKQQMSQTFDRVSRIAFPAIFAALTVFTLLV